jgi:alkyl hydroperoxide reductase subunit AhpC
MDCLVATLSVDPVKSHEEWLRDVVAHCENEIEVKFPIIGTYVWHKRRVFWYYYK